MKTTETEVLPVTQDDNLVLLDTPVKRGNTEIDQVTLRKPTSGELRGLNLSELLQLDVGSLIKLIPRITSLNEYEASKLDPADLVAIGTKVIGFLLQKRTKTDASLAA
ncbi:phage tail assembly protein [Pseudomonas huaxiensis]|uniref:phage tail assembly protein n=1 Tax=Pseudomonas huaxiensis TaxID=2213017 RepID=UPI000DA65547|nr:phage tail assembly protein [Pseudomonas huaxiensis]